MMPRGGRDRGGERESEKETEIRQPFSRIRFLIYRILKYSANNPLNNRQRGNPLGKDKVKPKKLPKRKFIFCRKISLKN
jgi:hypothetical protein